MTTSEKFCLKWNDFQKNVSTSFKDIREEFCDVTLVGEGNQKILAHKVILAASSNFFRDILKANQHPHPLLYMKGVKGIHMASVVEFMYNGEVNIFQEDLDDFLTVAEDLQLKGLQANKTENKEQQSDPFQSAIKPNKKPRTQSVNTNNSTLNNYEPKDEMASTNMEINRQVAAIHTPDNKIATTHEELDDTIRSMMTRSDGQWSCNLCGKANKDKQAITFHIEGKHIEGVSHPCNQCGKQFRSRNSLAVHMSNIHKVQK